MVACLAGDQERGPVRSGVRQERSTRARADRDAPVTRARDDGIDARSAEESPQPRGDHGERFVAPEFEQASGARAGRRQRRRCRPKRPERRGPCEFTCAAGQPLGQPVGHAALHRVVGRVRREQRDPGPCGSQERALRRIGRVKPLQGVEDRRVVRDDGVGTHGQRLGKHLRRPVDGHEHPAARSGAVAEEQAHVVPRFGQAGRRHGLHGRREVADGDTTGGGPAAGGAEGRSGSGHGGQD